MSGGENSMLDGGQTKQGMHNGDDPGEAVHLVFQREPWNISRQL
jgi:hypothetical protein